MMKKTFFKFVAASVAMFAGIAAFGDIVYISPTGSGDGSSESSPCDITTGWGKIASRPNKDMELILADGTYKISTQLAKVELYDSDGITYLIRSKSNNPANCIIDGQSQCRIAYITDGGRTSEKKRYAIIRGLTFKNGKNTDNSGSGGGAIYLQGRVENCKFENCCVESSSEGANGGAIYCLLNSTISNCTFKTCWVKAANTSSSKNSRGGAIYTHENGDCTIVDSSFDDCWAECNSAGDTDRGGGAIYSNNNKLFLRNLLINNCRAYNLNVGDPKYANYIRGGGVHTRYQGACVMENVKIIGCSTTGPGGAFFHNGGDENSSQRGNDVFTDCSFIDNEAGMGGAICSGYADNLTLVRCLIQGNSAAMTAAIAMALPNDLGRASGYLTMSNSVIRENRSTGGSTADSCGLIKIGRGATIVESVIEDNVVNPDNGTKGGGLFWLHSQKQLPTPPFLFENLIIRNNETHGAFVSGDHMFNDGIFRVNHSQNSYAFTNIVVRNCYITGNHSSTIAAIRNPRTDLRTEERERGMFFINCNITGNTLDSDSHAAMFVARDNENTSKSMVNVRNCDLRGNTGTTKVLDDGIFALCTKKVDHCAVDSGMTNYSAEPAQANLVGGPLPGKGAYMPWMDSALDGGDGTFTEVPSSTYGVKVTMNNCVPRYQGAKPDIGAHETNEGGTPLGPDLAESTLLSYTSITNAIVLSEGETFTLPAIEGLASYFNTSAHRFLAFDGTVITAMSAGIGAFKAYNRDGLYIGTIPVFIKPAGRQVDNAYILNVGSASTYAWSNPENWMKIGGSVDEGYPDGQSDIAFVPLSQSGTYINVDGSYSLAALYCTHILYSTDNTKYYLQGDKADGSASLTFFGTSGKNPVPSKLMASSLASGGIMEFYPRGSGLSSKITFKVGAGALELDLGGPVNKVKSASDPSHVVRLYSDNANLNYNIPEGCTLRIVNGIRYLKDFGNDEMWNIQHVNISGADIFTGSGVLELATCSPVSFGSNSLRLFHGTIRSQSLNFIRGLNSNRSGIVWSMNVDADNAATEIDGYCTREFNGAYGVGAWCSGNGHGYGEPNSGMSGNCIPGQSLTLNGGLLQLIGVNKSHSASTPYWSRGDGSYEAHYQTSNLRIGKGFSHIDNSWSGEVANMAAISHFIADKITHADSCGTLRVTDRHFIAQKTSIGVYRSENTFKGFSDFYVGYTGVPNYASNIFPIVPWIIGNCDGNADTFWWLGVDANGNVIRNGNRTNIDRNNMQPNQNAYVNGNIDIAADKDVNSLVLYNDGNRTKTLGNGRKLTIRSGGLGLEKNSSALGTQTGGDANGTVVFGSEESPVKAFVFATASSETQPNQIWSTIKAEKGFVSGYCGHLLLAGDQSGIKGELTINNGTLQLGSMDGSVACQLGGVTEVRAIGGNTVLRINKEGALDGKTIRFECPGSISPKFNLQNSEQEHCYKLFIDGQSIRSGTWGATGSGAANIDDEHFTGPGVLVVQRDDVGLGFSMVFRP